MADNWIKVRCALATHPKVVRIMSALKADRFRVLGGLVMMWSVFDTHSEDGILDGYTPALLDDILGWGGFSDAVVNVGWLQSLDGKLVAPQFETHNGGSAKRRANEAVRKASARDADRKREKSGPEKEKEKDSTPIVPKGTTISPQAVALGLALQRARALFRIRNSTPLDASEERSWKKNKGGVAVTPEADWLALEWWYRQPTGPGEIAEFRRTQFSTLLNNWNAEIGKAHSAADAEGINFAAQKKERAREPDGWQDILTENYPEIIAPDHFGQLPSSVRDFIWEQAEKKKGGDNAS